MAPTIFVTTLRAVRRLITGAALLGLAGFVSIQAIGPLTTPAAAAETDECDETIKTSDGSTWDCSFVENFDGTSLDRDKWIVQGTRWSGFYSGMTCFIDSPNNLQVGGGELKLIVRKERSDYDCTSPYGGFNSDYTGGGIITKPEFAQTYGRFEVRAKFPDVQTSGTHGGFWMYPPTLTYGKWPLSGEIDVAEWWSSDPTLVMPSLHYQGEEVFVDNGTNCRVSTPSSYHVYTVDWLPTGFKFFIDGKLCWSRTPEPDAPQVFPQPFDHPYSIVLSMGVGPATGTNAVNSQTTFPATFTVDYAKSYKKATASTPTPTPTPTTTAPTPTPTPTPVAATCGGVKATIVGTSYGETIRGTSGDDVIQALGGNDVIYGFGGNDRICGGDGSDRILGGYGNDLLYGESGNDTLSGESGHDKLVGGTGGDALSGGFGTDWAYYNDHAWGVLVTIGNNRRDDGNSTDGPSGARDNVTGTVERLYGSPGSDTMVGNYASNVLYGMGGNDLLRGGYGSDYLVGGAGADWLYGDANNDSLVGKDGRKDYRLDGGSGSDKASRDGGDPRAVSTP